VETTPPVAALTVIGIILAVLGLVVAANVVMVVIGLIAIVGAGLLQFWAARGAEARLTWWR
jgi:hypothetical protein